jgi:hypothetical protein
VPNKDKNKDFELEVSESTADFFRQIAASESPEVRAMKCSVSEGSDHPSEDQLRDHALGRLGPEEDRKIMDHTAFCAPCAGKVLSLIWHAEEAETPFIERIKRFISDLSFPMFMQVPPLELTRGHVGQLQEGSYIIGQKMGLSVEAPDAGHLLALHYCRETGQVNLVFPYYSTDINEVSAGQSIRIEGSTQGPAGRHGFLAVWTRHQVLDLTGFDLTDAVVNQQAVEEVLTRIEGLQEDECLTSVHEYEVVGG